MQIIFFLLAATALISGIMVVVQVNPVRSALFLVLNFFALAGIYLLANAQFIAAVQIIVYAGAIMVLFLFVIMLLNLRQPEEGGTKSHIGQKIFGASLATATAALVVYNIFKLTIPPGRPMVQDFGTTEMVAKSMFTEYLLPFEATSILLLVAVVGAVVLAKTKLD